MPKKSKPLKKQVLKRTQTTRKPRRLTIAKRIWYNPLTWHRRSLAPAYKPLPKARVLLARTLKLLWLNKRLFGGIVLVYGLLNILLVKGLAGSGDLSTLKGTLDAAFQGTSGNILSSLAGFSYLLSTSGSGNLSNAGAYQLMLFFVCSLAFIWALRQTLAKSKVRAKESFYQGMYPLIPYTLLFLFMMVQLIPLLLGSTVYGMVASNGIAVNAWEKTVWLTLFAILALWSLRMITATIFASYIVTLPDMTPRRAYRSACKLVYGRRLLLWRKLIFLPAVLLLLAALIELPLIMFVTPLATWMFFVLTMLTLPIVHAYLYNLYREMI